MKLQRKGFESRDLASDIALGLTDGLRMTPWSYIYASIICIVAMALFMPVGVLTLLVGRLAVSVNICLTSREPVSISTWPLPACVHGLMALALAERIDFMNYRLLSEAG